MKNKKCFECDAGNYQIASVDYPVELSGGESFTVPKVKILRCDSCGDEVVPAESSAQIEAYVHDKTEVLTKDELYNMFRDVNLDQEKFANVVGLGQKTYHRWLKGIQTPSRSMGYYLRVLAHFPEVFDWVEKRGWRNDDNGCSAGCASCNIGCTKFGALQAKYAGRDINELAGDILYYRKGENPAQIFAEAV
ncbi:MAG: type II toxin-antitoxin system MqsA family antitoxin [Kiritimatiellales bacterium]